MATEASFALNLFPDGFGIDRPTEKGQPPPLGYQVMDWLYPYERSSESFLSAIDGGWLPSDMLDEIPCTYVNGSVLCEIRDYRDCLPSNRMQAKVPSSVRGWAPNVEFVTLQPTVGNIIKDVARMADDTWSYTDLLEMESRILNVVRPPLSLHPSPDVAKKAHISFYDKWKLNSGLRATRRYRTHTGALASRRLRSAAKKFVIQAPDYVEPRAQNYQGSMDSVVDTAGRVNGSYQQESVKQENQENLEFASWGLSKNATDALKRGGDRELRQSSSSPSLSTPSIPLTNLSGNVGIEPPRGDSRLESASQLGKRENRESPGGRSEAKKVKQEQGKAEKVLPTQQKAHEKVETKNIKELQKKEKQQFHQRHERQLATHAQRTSPSALQFMKLEEVSMHDSYLASRSDPKPRSEEKYEPAELTELQDDYVEEGVYKGVDEDQHAPVPLQQHDQNQQRPLEPDTRVRQQGMKPERQDSLLSEDIKLDQASMTWGQKLVGRAQMPAPIAQAVHATASPLISNSNPILGPPLTASSANASQLADKPGVNGSTLSQVGAVGQMDQPADLLQSQADTLQGVRGRIVSGAKSSAPNSLVKGAGAGSPAASPKTAGSPVASPLLDGQWARKVSPSTVALLTAIRSQNLHIKKKKPVELPAANNTPPRWQLLLDALSDTPDEFKEQIGCRKMATSLVAGSVNTRRNRTLMFQRLETVFQGQSQPVYHRSRIRLCMNQQRSKDQMVEAWILMGDELDDESQNMSALHHVQPPTPAMGVSKQVFVGVYALHEADRFASQFSDLLRKEGYELIEDDVFATTRPAASNARPMSAGATTLLHANSPRVNMTPHVQPMIGGSQLLQPSSPSSFRMPPPGNPANRQLLASHLGQSVVGATAKPLALDPASQLAVQHNQLVQHQLQRPQVSISPSQLAAQMTGQQLNTPMVGHSPHLQQYQYLHQQHQQQQQQQQQHQQHQQQKQHQQHNNMIQRKLLSNAMGMGGMNGISSMNGPAGMGSLVGLNGMNGISGMSTMSPMTGPMMGLPGLTNMGINALNQNSVGNLLNQQLRSGPMANGQTLSSKSRIAPHRNRTGTLTGQGARTPLDNLAPLVAAAQLQGTSGVMMGQGPARANLATMQRAAGMASPKGNPAMSGVAGQSFSMNAAPNPQQVGQNPQQLTGQQLIAQQHLASQPLNSTLNVGGLGSLVGGPGSPQLGTQSLSSVTGLTTAAMDLQNVNRGNSLMTATRGRIRAGQPGQSSQ